MGTKRSLLGCQKCSLFLAVVLWLCLLCKNPLRCALKTHALYCIYVNLCLNKNKWRKEKRSICMHPSQTILLRRWFPWPLLLNNGGSRLSDFPKVTQIARGRVKMQVHVLIAKAVLFQRQDQGLSRLTSALDDLWLRTHSATGMLDFLYFDMVGFWAHEEAKPLAQEQSIIFDKKQRKSKPGTRQDRDQESGLKGLDCQCGLHRLFQGLFGRPHLR